MPYLTRRVVDIEALSAVSTAGFVAFMKNAAANFSPDAVRARELAVGSMNIPLADPEIEGSVLWG